MNISKRRGNIYRLLAIYLIKNHTALSLKEVGEIFSMDYTAVSQAAKRFEARISKDKSLKKKVEQILEKINIEMSNVET
jgi:chromosomal replication initiation ATPase DnaA